MVVTAALTSHSYIAGVYFRVRIDFDGSILRLTSRFDDHNFDIIT